MKAVIDWQTAMNRYNAYEKSISGNFTFDPAMNQGYILENDLDAKLYHNNYSKNKEPVYNVGMTNQLGHKLTGKLQPDYIQAMKMESPVLIVRWNDDETGLTYTDIAMPVNDESDAREIASFYEQKVIAEIKQNGKGRLVKISKTGD